MVVYFIVFDMEFEVIDCIIVFEEIFFVYLLGKWIGWEIFLMVIWVKFGRIISLYSKGNKVVVVKRIVDLFKVRG